MFWRRRNTSKEKDYEKLLADIDLDIKKIEENLRQIKIREDRTIVTWLYYSIPVYSLVLIVYCFLLYQNHNPWPVFCIQALPLLIGLFLIIFIKKFISIWYKKQQMKEEEKSIELKKEQKKILEELKSKLKYYQTKNLIEKYEFQDEQGFSMKNNGMPMMQPHVNVNSQRMNQNQFRNQQMVTRKQQLMGGHNLSKQRSMPVVLQNGKQQFTDMRYNQQHNQQYPPQYGAQTQSNPNERKWIDKLMDAIVGDVNEADSKYALVCNYCYTHCGLALPEEYKTFKFKCPSCKKLNDNAKKYNVKDPNNNKIVDKDHMLSPPSAPVEKPNNLNIVPVNTQSKSVPVTPQQPSSIILEDNNKKPNLMRRSSTLLDEMDDSTNTDTTTFNQNNQISANVNLEESINEGTNENTDEALDHDINKGVNKYEQEIEQEKEVISYQEENDINNSNSIKTMVEDNEIKESSNNEEINFNSEIVDDNMKEPLIPSSIQEQNFVNDNEQIMEENLQQ